MGRYKKFSFPLDDHAIQLELIVEVHGIAGVENYFVGLLDMEKNQLT